METKSEASVLSEKEIVLLGLIAEEPSHAYRLETKIRERRMDQWTEIGFSSIYRILSGLERKKLIETTLEHKGQGATRKVHRITESGLRTLAQSVLERLESVERPRFPFQVAIAYLMHAPLGEALIRMKVRRGVMGRIHEELLAMMRGHLGDIIRLGGEGLTFLHNHDTEAKGGEGTLEGEGTGRPIDCQGGRVPFILLFNHVLAHVEAEITFMDQAMAFLAAQGGKK